MIELFLNLLLVQGLLGAFDTVYHHELTVALPRSVTARRELSIHALRALLYGAMFFGLAWFTWHGLWVVALVGLVLVEVGLTLWDFVVEDTTRVLPASERIAHTMLAINAGAAFALLALHLPHWYEQATALVLVHYGWRSWLLSALALGVVISGLRDALAAWQLQRLDLDLGLDLGCVHKRILVSGATGFIGSALVHELLRDGHSVTVLSRRPVAAAVHFGGNLRAVRSTEALHAHEQFDAVINLAGAPIVGMPWSEKRRRVLLSSRLNTTEELLRFVRRAQRPPHVWLQASAIGYYGTKATGTRTEEAPAGDGFAASLCQQWEDLSSELDALSIRRVTLRMGLVFGRSGGALPMMLLPFRLGLGAVLGNGRQHVGWIHLEDLLRLIAHAIADEFMRGTFNAVAPDSPTYAQFARAVGKALQRPVWLHLPAGLLRGGLGEMASLFVDGPHVMPRRLQESGFEYRFPDLRAALMDLS